MKGIKFTFLSLIKIMHNLNNLKTKFSIIFVLFLLFFRGSCDPPPPVDPDWRGMRISKIFDEASNGQPVSNERNVFRIYWILNINNNNFDVHFNLFSRDQTFHISYLGSSSIRVTSGQYGEDYLWWNGKMTAGLAREVPVPLGDYSVRLRYFYDGQKYA